VVTSKYTMLCGDEQHVFSMQLANRVCSAANHKQHTDLTIQWVPKVLELGCPHFHIEFRRVGQKCHQLLNVKPACHNPQVEFTDSLGELFQSRPLNIGIGCRTSMWPFEFVLERQRKILPYLFALVMQWWLVWQTFQLQARCRRERRGGCGCDSRGGCGACCECGCSSHDMGMRPRHVVQHGRQHEYERTQRAVNNQSWDPLFNVKSHQSDPKRHL
jgi:hypothetical protein